MGTKTIEITNANFEKEIINSEKPAIVDFWAPWCMPCKMIAPTLDEIADDYKGKINVAKINVDDSPELATELSIFNIPTIVFFKSGKEHSRLVGVNTKEVIDAKIEKIASEE